MIDKLLWKNLIPISFFGIIIQTTGGQLKASAFTLSPDTISSTWTQGPEVVYGVSSWFGNSRGLWGVDDTRQKVPFDAITNYPIRIGKSSDADTEGYASLVSDFHLRGNSTFSGSFFMPNDNDIVGLLFGYQDQDNHYRLSWGSSRVKRGSVTDGPYERVDLSPSEAGSDEIGSGGMVIVKEKNGVSTFFESAFDYNLRWATDILYDFSVSRMGDDLSISITEGGNSVFSTMITDTTFLGGKVGFNTAGVEVFYGNIQINAEEVPEPLTILGSGFAIGFGIFLKRKRLSEKMGGEIYR